MANFAEDYFDEFASVKAKMYRLQKQHIINVSDEADVPYVGTSGEPTPSRPITTLTPAAFSFSGTSIGSNTRFGLSGGAKRTVNVMLDDETPSFYSNNQTGGFADKAVEDELMGGSSCCGCEGGAQFRARTDTGLLPRGFINKTNIQSGGFEAINRRLPNYRNSGSNLNAIGEAATLGYGHEGISSSSTNSAMNVMILQDPYDKKVPAYNPTQIFSPTAAYDMTASDFKGMHGGGYAGGMIGLPFKMPDMKKESPECEEILQRPVTKEVRPTKYNGKTYDNPMSAKNAKLYDQCVARQGRSSPEVEEMEGAGPGQSKEKVPGQQSPAEMLEGLKIMAIEDIKLKQFPKDYVDRQISGSMRMVDASKPASVRFREILTKYKEILDIPLTDDLTKAELKTNVSKINVLLSELENMIGRSAALRRQMDSSNRDVMDRLEERLQSFRVNLVDIQKFFGSAKPMPESEPENDEDLKKALRGMGLPAQ